MKLVFDIGANIGKFCSAYKQKYPDCRIICVEPAYEFLRASYADPENDIMVVPYACSDTCNEHVDFHFNEYVTTISSCNQKWISDSRFKDYNNKWVKKQVKTVTIDYLIEEFGCPDYIKVDVEGYELTALNGLTQKVPLLGLEWAEELKEEVVGCVDRLNALGFKQFCVQDCDGYLDLPADNDFRDYKTVRDYLTNELDSDRKEKWGMIYSR